MRRGTKAAAVKASAALLALSAGAAAVHAATHVTLDLRPYADGPATNHANRYDGFGYLESGLLDYVHSGVEEARDRGSTAPAAELAELAWREVTESPSTWHLHCVCVKQERCPCKTLTEILTGVPPAELDADVRELVDQTPSARPTRAQILDTARRKLRIADMAPVARGYDDIMLLVEGVVGESISESTFYGRMVELERRWSSSLSGTALDFPLKDGAMARSFVRYGRGSDGRPHSDTPEWIDCAILGAALGGWGGALVLGGGCFVATLPWYPEEEEEE